MVQRRVQMIYLTATLAIVNMPKFIGVIKVEIPEDNIFQGSTSRRNIAYLVVEHKGGVEEAHAVRSLVAQKVEEYLALAKIIIYQSSIVRIKELRKELDCPMYYAKVGSKAEKKLIRQRQEAREEHVVVASNAFRLGINQPNVRVIMHVRLIYQMKSYGQESGRAEQDGKQSKAIILVGSGRQEALKRHYKRIQQQGVLPQVAITKEDKKRA